MASYQQQIGGFNGQTPLYYPYNNTIAPPYQNYVGRQNQQNMYNQDRFLRCRPVSSREEAMASQIDLDGSLWVFTDVNNGRIYTKQINNDGTASFNTYVYTQEELNYNNSNQFVTKEEFNKVIQGLIATINSQENKVQANTVQTKPTF